MSLRAIALLAAVAAAAYGLDQLTKYLVVEHLAVGGRVPLLGEVLQLHHVTNSGAAFSLASGFTWILSVVAAGVVVFIVWSARRLRALPWAIMLGLVLGGALGNLTDRLFREPGFGIGHVVDFIQVIAFPAIFNVADMAIVAAMALLILLTLRGVRLDGAKEAPRPRRRRPAGVLEDDPDGERDAGGS